VRDLPVRKKANEKADSSPVQKPNEVRNDIFFEFFRSLLGIAIGWRTDLKIGHYRGDV
jgi:hypothetical protein